MLTPTHRMDRKNPRRLTTIHSNSPEDGQDPRRPTTIYSNHIVFGLGIQLCWYKLAFLILGRLRQKDYHKLKSSLDHLEFKSNLGYIMKCKQRLLIHFLAAQTRIIT